jgi:hypothetical protein
MFPSIAGSPHKATHVQLLASTAAAILLLVEPGTAERA